MLVVVLLSAVAPLAWEDLTCIRFREPSVRSRDWLLWTATRYFLKDVDAFANVSCVRHLSQRFQVREKKSSKSSALLHTVAICELRWRNMV